jgi:hypothetical protein
MTASTGSTGWRSTERLAWTGHDGPTRPPPGFRPFLQGALAIVLAAVFTGMVMTDALCPDHRAWVQGLGSIALIGCVASTVALVRGWAIAPVITLGTTLIGVAIGVIDAEHDATRGWLIAASFTVALVGAAGMGFKQLRLRSWERQQSAIASIEDPTDVVRTQPTIIGSGSEAGHAPAPRHRSKVG